MTGGAGASSQAGQSASCSPRLSEVEKTKRERDKNEYKEIEIKEIDRWRDRKTYIEREEIER